MTPASGNGESSKPQRITPHMVVRDAARAAEWYRHALGAVERSRVPVPGGKLLQVELWFGDSPVMIADEFPELGAVSPLDGGATVVAQLNEAFWGERYGQLRDPFGHKWDLAQHRGDVPHDELARAATAAFGG